MGDRSARLEEIAAQLRERGVDVETTVKPGTAAALLVSVAEAVGADAIVVGDRGLKGIRGVLSSVPNTVAHKARTDVLIVHTT
jgi:nucleotide-binding universal stress UspA family protein